MEVVIKNPNNRNFDLNKVIKEKVYGTYKGCV